MNGLSGTQLAAWLSRLPLVFDDFFTVEAVTEAGASTAEASQADQRSCELAAT
jgi:hypothetical protein